MLQKPYPLAFLILLLAFAGVACASGADEGISNVFELNMRPNEGISNAFDMSMRPDEGISGPFELNTLQCEYTGLFNNEATATPPGQGPMFAGLLPTMSQPISDVFYVIGYDTWRDYDIEYLEEVLDHTRAHPGDGLPDRFQMALVEYALCHPASRYHDEALAGFLTNRATFISDIEDLQAGFPDLASLLPLADLFAGMMGTSEVMQTTLNAIIQMLTNGSTGLPRLDEYVVFGIGAKTPDEPFSAEGDFDGDGISNVTEYDDVMDAGGDLGVFLEAATDPSPFWPGNPDVPVTGVIGLGIMAGVLLAGAGLLARKHKCN